MNCDMCANPIDLSLISDESLNSEYWRRMRARRQSAGGRPETRRPCAKCGRKFGAVKLRKHEPNCTGSLRPTLSYRDASTAAHRLMDLIKDGRQWNIAVVNACLTNEWELQNNAQDSDFHPCTIKHFISAYRSAARRKGSKKMDTRYKATLDGETIGWFNTADEAQFAVDKASLVLCRSDNGDGGWSLHAPESSDEDIATGDAPYLLTGEAEWIDGGWNRPNDEDYAAAVRIHTKGEY